MNLPKKLTFSIEKYNSINGYLYDTLTSTNDQAWQLRTENRQLPFVVISKQQTSGKGQRGKKWESSEGGLYMSVAVELNLPVKYSHHLTLLTLVGIALEFNHRSIPVKIKWLNDLILAQKKLGGILWETKLIKNVIREAVIGVGINYNNFAPDCGINLTYFLQKTSINIPSLESVYYWVVSGIFNSYQKYQNQGIKGIIDDYNKLLYNGGEKVIFSQNQGRILGINDEGNLMVKMSSLNAQSIVSFCPHNYCISSEVDEKKCYYLKEKTSTCT